MNDFDKDIGSGMRETFINTIEHGAVYVVQVVYLDAYDGFIIVTYGEYKILAEAMLKAEQVQAELSPTHSDMIIQVIVKGWGNQ